MLKKWILISVLFANLFSSSLFAKDTDGCEIHSVGFQGGLWLMSCTLSSTNVKQLEQYLQVNPTVDSLALVMVDFDTKVGAELSQMLIENQTLNSLYFHETNLGSSELARLAHNKNLKNLALYGNQIDDSGIAALTDNNHSISGLYLGERSVSMPVIFQFLDNHHLNDFGLSDVAMTDGDLDELVHKHAHFKSLILAGLNLSNLQPLQYLDKITTLGVQFMNVTDKDAEAIGTLKQLRYLDVVNTNLSAYAANQFSNLKNLKMIYIMSNDPGIGDEGVQFIKQLPHLTSAYLAHQNITDVGARAISDNTQLTDIALVDNLIGDKGAIALSRNSQLMSVDLDLNHVGDSGAAAFANHASLRRIFLRHNRVGDMGGTALANQANLLIIGLDGNLLTDLTAYAFADRTADLDYLGIIANPISKHAYEAMKNNPHIKYLFAGYIGDSEIQRQQLAKLEHLYQYIHRDKP